MKSQAFLQQLQEQVQAQLSILNTDFEPLDIRALQFKPAPASWSILECLEHLNRYARYYLPALRKALAQEQPTANPEAQVGFSWLGRKSYEAVRPENRKLQKTLRHMNPAQSTLDRSVLPEFRQHQETLLRLLSRAAHTNLNRKAIPIEFFHLLKLRLGEAFLFVIAHQERHLQQAQRARQQYQSQATNELRLVV